MLDFVVLTAHQVSNCCDDPEKIIAEQEEKREVFGLADDDLYFCKFTNGHSGFFTLDEAIQYLDIKEGFDMVQFSNGNLGFIAYYDGMPNGFEILDREV